MKKEKKKGDFSKALIVFILIHTFIFGWAYLILSAIAGVEIAPAFGVAYLSFCGAEYGLLAWIKNNKTKKGDEENEGMDYTEIDEP